MAAGPGAGGRDGFEPPAPAPLSPGQGNPILRRDRPGEPPGRVSRLTPERRLPTDSTIRTLLDGEATRTLVDALADRIDEAVPAERRLVLVGIRRRGDSIARALGERLKKRRGEVPTGSLDITLYRDDFAQLGALPEIGTSDMPSDISGAHVVIVDDVLYTGRTIRAALNELADFGRAARVELCVLVDRGGRQLPIQPDYAGHVVDVPPGFEVSVRVADVDGEWGVDLVSVEPEPGAPGRSEETA